MTFNFIYQEDVTTFPQPKEGDVFVEGTTYTLHLKDGVEVVDAHSEDQAQHLLEMLTGSK